MPAFDDFDVIVRNMAHRWHGGQGSPLHALASTGAIVPGLERELWAARADALIYSDSGAELLETIDGWAGKVGERGPVDGWSRIPIDLREIMDAGYEQAARALYGEGTVDLFMSTVLGVDPHAARCECSEPERCLFRDRSALGMPVWTR